MQNYETQRSKGCIALDLRLTMLTCWPFNPNMDKLPHCAVIIFPLIRCLWSGFCFGQYLMFLCSLAITHHALVHCKLSVPYTRPARTTAMPCSSVSHGENSTLNLGQVCITSNIVDADLTTPQRPATNPNPNRDDMNP